MSIFGSNVPWSTKILQIVGLRTEQEEWGLKKQFY